MTPAATSDAEPASVPLHWCFRASHGIGSDSSAPVGNGGRQRFRSDSTVVWNGSRSAFVGESVSAGAGASGSAVWQAIVAEPYRGQRIELVAFVRTRLARFAHVFVRSQAEGPLELWLSDQNTPVAARGLNQPVGGTMEWSRVAVVHDVPADAVVLYYGILLFGGGGVWIDDVRINVVDASVGLTHSGSVAGIPPILLDPRFVLPAPANLDFEDVSDERPGAVAAGTCAPRR